MAAQKKCKECDTPVEATAAKASFEKYGGIFCIECRRKIDKAIADGLIKDDSAQGAPCAPHDYTGTETPKNVSPPGNMPITNEPAQQTHNVGDGSGDDVPVVKYDERPPMPEVVDDLKRAQRKENAIAVNDPEIASNNTPIDMDTIKKYICPTATDKEAFAFMQLCKARNLNPFTKEAYLLKYGNGAATMVVGKDAFTRRAEDNPQFDGFEAGIITEYEIEGKVHTNEYDGTFMRSDEKLVGGWAKVYRKDHKYPVTARVSMKEYDTGKSSWAKMPATMIRKVALVQALRESFPSDLGGCYDSSEMGAEI